MSTMVTGDPVIEVSGLRKVYRGRVAVDEISFQVRRGEIFGLLGPNGAGKTTTVEMLQGLRPRDGGSVSVLGLDPARSASALRRRIGSQLQSSALPARMRVREALALFASLADRPADPEALLDDWSLRHLAGRPFDKLSGGERQRLFIALALVNQPELVFLDELTTGLDPSARRATWKLIERIRDRGTTVVLVTHFMEEAEHLCDRLVVVHHGQIIARGTPSELASRNNGHAEIDMRLDTDPSFLEPLSSVESITRRGDRVVVVGGAGLVFDVAAALAERGLRPADFRTKQPTLEDAFLTLVGE